MGSQYKSRSKKACFFLYKPKPNPMSTFFIRYRKISLAATIYMFLYFLYEMYDGIESITSTDKTYKAEGIGTLINACFSLFIAAVIFIYVRKANKKVKEENVSSN
jgi:hypothetical protein